MPATPISMAPTAGPDGPRQRPAGAQDPNGAIERVRVRLTEISLSESDRLGEGGRANRDRERGDQEQSDEIGCQSKQSVADGGTGERHQKRRHARSLVDPGAKRRAEPDAAQRPRGQDGAQRQRAEARPIDEKEHEVGPGDRVREAREDVDDDERNEKRRAVGVRGQTSLVVATNDAQGFSVGSESSD
jgi:hypothetical protein